MAKKLSNLPQRIKDTLPINVLKALDTFTDKELDSLDNFWSFETGEFLGIGFIDPITKKMTGFGNIEKHQALLIIEQQIISEMKNGPTESISRND